MATRQMIAGILWKELKGVLMQVDAPFVYILNKEADNLRRKRFWRILHIIHMFARDYPLGQSEIRQHRQFWQLLLPRVQNIGFI